MVDRIEQSHMLTMAGYRCEYCRRDLMGDLYELDHITPQALEGPSIKSNFAVSCGRCNRNKGKRTHYVDPHTHTVTCLYNPRAMHWENHFHFIDGEVVGKTVEGRATAALLFRATPRYSPPDLSWSKLERIASNDYLYRFLNHLRYLRLQNEFGLLKKLVQKPPQGLEATESELAVASNITNFLLLELHFTRSQGLDVLNGITIGEALLQDKENTFREDIKGALSILYQQRATIRYNSGDITGARFDQQRSYKLHAGSRKNSARRLLFSTQESLRTYLRAISLAHKYEEIQMSSVQLRELLEVAIDLKNERDFSHFTYLADLILLTKKPVWPALEMLYVILTNLLEVGGYGTSLDMAKLVTIRRRWWALHCLLESEIWLEALRGDLVFWKEVNMYNEIRELYSLLKRTAPRTVGKQYTDAMTIVAAYSVETSTNPLVAIKGA